MEKIIVKLPMSQPKSKAKIKVAAYARVSTGKDSMIHSLKTQVEYYEKLIKANEKYEFAGVFYDKGLTGTKEERPGFQALLNNVRKGSIDLVICKSISRFARNTVTLLETIREFKKLGVNVYFEEQNIYTLSSEGELLITLLASFAQEESRSASENLKWRIRNNFKQGLVWNTSVLGYKLEKGVFYVVEDEAKIVRKIYSLFLKGMGTPSIVEYLKRNSYKTKHGREFSNSSVRIILTNYLYTGNVILQRFYKDNHITKRKVENTGELPKYHVENTHEPIISLSDFNNVQDIILARAESAKRVSPHKKSVLTGKLTCENCGAHYHRKTTPYNTYWICPTYSMRGKKYCQSKQIPEEILKAKICECLQIKKFDEEEFIKNIKEIKVQNNNILTIIKNDNSQFTTAWQDKSRSLSWTDEMKDAARKRALGV